MDVGPGRASMQNPRKSSELSNTHEPARGLPSWGVDDLPEPALFSTRNLFRIIGPGAIMLAASIGGGEWLAVTPTEILFHAAR